MTTTYSSIKIYLQLARNDRGLAQPFHSEARLRAIDYKLWIGDMAAAP